MRLWSLHPCYMDAKGLVALWREGLLAQKVLQGKTKGYRNHPQLTRFKQQNNPVDSIAGYLHEVHSEAERRGYHFDASKIAMHESVKLIPVTRGQISYEYLHLASKLKVRDLKAFLRLQSEIEIKTHPLFIIVRGEVESWELVK